MPDTSASPTAWVPHHSVRWLPPLLRPTDEELLPRTRSERTRRDWIVDGVAVLVTIVAGIASHQAARSQGAHISGFREIVDLAALPVGAAALLWRRRWPLHIAVFVGTLTLVAPAPGLAVAFAAFAVAAYSPPTTALLGVGFLVATAPLSSYVTRAMTDEPWVGNAIFGVVVTTLIGGWGMFAGTRRQLLVTLKERARRAEAEQSVRVEQARLQERSRIAREMHDVLAHRMSLLSVHAGALEFRPDAPAADVARSAAVIRQTAHQALEELRTVIGVLRVDELLGEGADRVASPAPPQPTLADLSTLVDEWRSAGARIDCELALAPADVPPAVGRAAYRVAQEALTNASKHAPAARVQLRLSGSEGTHVCVDVRNALPMAGARVAAIPGTGFGLVGLRERMELAGGEFSAAPDHAAGQFLLRATLPWPAA
jgi:signal transduction histidine kinase